MGIREDSDDARVWRVVVNDEEQYSIWPAERENALGWRASGFQGTKQECLSHIESVWTDMRPRSLREAQAAECGTSVGRERPADR
jgi:MbtH protein